jgi:opacity protein-like surface antigen
MRVRTSLIASLLLVVASVPAQAQSSIGLRGYVTYGSTTFSATESFEAITGESRKAGVGGGAVVTGLWRGLFVDAGVTQQTLSGERVFVDAGTVYRLGIPVSIKMRPVDLAAGWRLSYGRLSPYAGAGATFLSYEETAEFAEPGDNVSESKTGALFLTGLDVSVNRWLHVGAEFRYRSVSGVLGDGGVSEVFNEDQLGGYAFALRVSLGK